MKYKLTKAEQETVINLTMNWILPVFTPMTAV